MLPALSKIKPVYLWGAIPLIVFVLLAVVMLFSLVGGEKIRPLLPRGIPLPQFSLPAVESGADRLDTGDFGGQYSLLNIFASWCLSCLQEHPLLHELKAKGTLPIYGINWRDKQENARMWLNQYGNPYDKIGADFDGDVIVELGVTGAPETFLVSPKGTIVYHHVGPLTQQVLKNDILPIIGK